MRSKKFEYLQRKVFVLINFGFSFSSIKFLCIISGDSAGSCSEDDLPVDTLTTLKDTETETVLSQIPIESSPLILEQRHIDNHIGDDDENDKVDDIIENNCENLIRSISPKIVETKITEEILKIPTIIPQSILPLHTSTLISRERLNCDKCNTFFTEEEQEMVDHREICGIVKKEPIDLQALDQMNESEDIIDEDKALRHSEDAANNNSSEGDDEADDENDSNNDVRPDLSALAVGAAAAAAAAAALAPGHVTLEALQNTKVAVAQFAATAMANPNSETALKEFAMLQSTLYSLQHQQVLQLQLIQQLQSRLTMNNQTTGGEDGECSETGENELDDEPIDMEQHHNLRLNHPVDDEDDEEEHIIDEDEEDLEPIGVTPRLHDDLREPEPLELSRYVYFNFFLFLLIFQQQIIFSSIIQSPNT